MFFSQQSFTHVACFPEVVGSWRDADGTTYKITLDASGSSCSAMIQAPDGALYEAKEDIICEDQGVPSREQQLAESVAIAIMAPKESNDN